MIAAVETPAFLGQVVALLVGGALVAYLGARVGVFPIVGFLIAGVVIGPNALGVVNDLEVVNAAAEVGVILLLFTIGLDFSLERLARLRRLIFLGGGLQVALATGLTVAILLALGVDWPAAVFTGFLVALSSTAIVLSLLSKKGESDEDHGRVGLGFLIFQDLAIIPMVLLVPALGGQGESIGEIVLALAAAVGIIAAVLIVARRLMPTLLEEVARTCSPEVFLITVIAVCFGTAYLTSLAGVSVSLGAFLAGLIVRESRFGQHALGEILPLQIVFSGTFFVSVGMLLDLGFVVGNLPLVLGAIAGVLIVKVVATGLSAKAFGYSTGATAATALMLAQVGEFSFVLERVGSAEGLSPGGLGEDGTQTLIAATVLLMAATPPLASLGTRLRSRVDGGAARDRRREPDAFRGYGAEAELAISDHVILAGYGEAARAAVPELRRAGVPFVITTLNPGGARQAADEGLPVLQGDHTKPHLLERAGIHVARLLVVADDDLETAYRVAAVARGLNPQLPIVARTEQEQDVGLLADAGVVKVVTGERASAERLQDAVLTQLGLDGAASQASAIDTQRVVRFEPSGEGCAHLSETRPVQAHAAGCEECLRMGDPWVHLRLCLSCGHVGCCDSSPGRHASRHAAEHSHAVARSAEPGEEWAWCYVDEKQMTSAS